MLLNSKRKIISMTTAMTTITTIVINNENNHGNYIYFSIISNNICSNLYLYRKIQHINNNHGNQK